VLSPSRRKELALDLIDRAAHDRVQRARDEAHQEIAAARQRIEAMHAEHAELGRLRRSRRAAIEQDIARQEEAMEWWSAEAEQIAAAPVLDVALRIEHEASSLLDRDAARVAMLDPEAPQRHEWAVGLRRSAPARRGRARRWR
jgi:hypothetical protein